MKEGHFYFLKDKYFVDFPDNNLMNNKETVNNIPHNRPCFCAFQDIKTNLFWLIPISSKVNKFKNIYQQKIQKYKVCDTIVFGSVLGHQKAILIQNMFPIKDEYIDNEYLDRNQNIVKFDNKTEKEVLIKARKILALQRTGKKVILPNVLQIENELLSS